MTDEELAQAALAAVDAKGPAEPPPGFSDRVLAARRGTRAVSVRASAAVGAGLAAAAVAAFALVISQRGSNAHGSARTQGRQTVLLDRRGVAVAEGGSLLRWSVAANGEARVEQEHGDVFYRVEPGGPFTVSLSGVAIAATGTCFRVEEQMGVPGKMALSAAAGALVSAVVVSVYEGRVQVRTPQGGVELAAGERAEVQPGGAPRVVPIALSATPSSLLATPPAESGQASREELVAHERASNAQIAALQTRVRELTTEREKLASRIATSPGHRREEGEEPDENGLPPGNKTHDFTPDELAAMAKSCEVRIDMPPLGHEPWKMSPELGARMRLSDDEQAAATTVVNKIRTDAQTYLRGLYLQTTGDQAGADNLSAMTLGQEILHKSRPEDVDAARKKIALERAGMSPRPADPNIGTIPERYFRYLTSLGDTVQQELEPVAGAQQAGRLRDAIDGMRMHMNGCKDER